MARRIDVLGELWSHLADFEVGFCFDTCHAHAAGEDLDTVVPRVIDAVGRIDLLHANDSRDPAGTGADRHANFGDGHMDETAIVKMVEQSGAPVVICETPWPQIADDIGRLRRRFGGG
jgi:deoxyribonuclease-4